MCPGSSWRSQNWYDKRLCPLSVPVTICPLTCICAGQKGISQGWRSRLVLRLRLCMFKRKVCSSFRAPVDPCLSLWLTPHHPCMGGRVISSSSFLLLMFKRSWKCSISLMHGETKTPLVVLAMKIWNMLYEKRWRAD